MMATMSAFILFLRLGGNNVDFCNYSVASIAYSKVTERLQMRNVPANDYRPHDRVKRRHNEKRPRMRGRSTRHM